MTKPVIIIGGGGHAKVLIDALRLRSVRILGIMDPALAKGTRILDLPVLGDDAAVDAYGPDQVDLVNALGSIHVPVQRKAIFERFSGKGYRFAAVLHPSAVIASDVELGEGVQVMAGAVIQAGSRIGRNAIVNTRASVDHDCSIGEHVHVAPGVTLSGSVSIGDLVHVGTAAVVIQGTAIGRNSMIGAGALVLEAVPEDSTVLGSPAKPRTSHR